MPKSRHSRRSRQSKQRKHSGGGWFSDLITGKKTEKVQPAISESEALSKKFSEAATCSNNVNVSLQEMQEMGKKVSKGLTDTLKASLEVVKAEVEKMKKLENILTDATKWDTPDFLPEFGKKRWRSTEELKKKEEVAKKAAEDAKAEEEFGNWKYLGYGGSRKNRRYRRKSHRKSHKKTRRCPRGSIRHSRKRYTRKHKKHSSRKHKKHSSRKHKKHSSRKH
jgi:hypothetical protein